VGQKIPAVLIALGSGFMLGTVFVEMIPESFALTRSAPALVLLGYFIVHMFEHTFASHLHFGEETHPRRTGESGCSNLGTGWNACPYVFRRCSHRSRFHYLAGRGLLIFLAVFLHKIPDGFTISSIVVSSGQSNSRAGCGHGTRSFHADRCLLCAYCAGEGVNYALPISTGSTLYVAATDLMPEVNEKRE